MTYRVDTIACVAFEHGEVDCPPEGERFGCVDCRWSRAYDSGRERMKRTVAQDERREGVRCELCGEAASHAHPVALCESHHRDWTGSHEAARAKASMADWLTRVRAEKANGNG